MPEKAKNGIADNRHAMSRGISCKVGVVFRHQPNETFTPVGDDNGLFILPIKDRIWIPNSGVPAKLLPVKVKGDANGKEWEVRGVPYELIC